MPVKLEHIRTPSPADWQDLEKIHLDTAENGFQKTTSELETWLAEGGWIVAGRFNDRLIGALLAKEASDNTVTLSQAGVRTVTQRRGVMHQMAHFISRWGKEEGKALVISQCPVELESALEHRGFHLNGNDWTLNP